MIKCDHTSVGILVWRDQNLLMIERKKYPFGWAIPAGHVDEHGTYEDAARAELYEEVGLQAVELKLIMAKKLDNPCRRPDGTWHNWKVYQAETIGQVQPSKSEVKKYQWCDQNHLKVLARRTEEYLNNQIDQANWEKNPGLEKVCYEWFKNFKII